MTGEGRFKRTLIFFLRVDRARLFWQLQPCWRTFLISFCHVRLHVWRLLWTSVVGRPRQSDSKVLPTLRSLRNSLACRTGRLAGKRAKRHTRAGSARFFFHLFPRARGATSTPRSCIAFSFLPTHPPLIRLFSRRGCLDKTLTPQWTRPHRPPSWLTLNRPPKGKKKKPGWLSIGLIHVPK